MDPVTLIVTALASGAGAGLEDSASSLVKDSYSRLKGLVTKRLSRRPDGALVLARYEQEPKAWATSLASELAAAEAYDDAELLAAAQEMMNLLGKAGSQARAYVVDTRWSQGVQVGDRNTQHNTFGSSPGELPMGHIKKRTAVAKYSDCMPCYHRSIRESLLLT
jgi:hypothetical protein